jgi:hypothetical protein
MLHKDSCHDQKQFKSCSVCAKASDEDTSLSEDTHTHAQCSLLLAHATAVFTDCMHAFNDRATMLDFCMKPVICFTAQAVRI